MSSQFPSREFDHERYHRSRTPNRSKRNSNRRSRSVERDEKVGRSERGLLAESSSFSNRRESAKNTTNESKPRVEKIIPNFELSGKLYEEKMTVNGVVLKYAEPADAAVPLTRWRIFVFKPDSKDPVETLYLHRQSKYLFGRDKRVADIAVEHLSCSSQHAVIQFRKREIPSLLADEPSTFVVKPFLLDLNSTHGTSRNSKLLEPARYFELRSKDLIKLGQSTREYVIIEDAEVDHAK